MCNNIVRKILIDFISSKMYLIILLFVLCGTFVFTSFNTITPDYITNMNYSLVSHKNLYTFLIYPVVTMFIIMLYYKISKNSMLILRIKNKKEYFKIQLKSATLLTTIFFIQYLLIIMISINLNRDVNFGIITDEYYNTTNIIALLVNMFKIYMSLITLQFIALVNLALFRNKQLSLILIFTYVFYVHMSYKLEYIEGLKYIIPSVHTYSYFIYNNMFSSFIISFIYYVVVLTIMYFLSKKLILKNSIEKEVLS